MNSKGSYDAESRCLFVGPFAYRKLFPLNSIHRFYPPLTREEDEKFDSFDVIFAHCVMCLLGWNCFLEMVQVVILDLSVSVLRKHFFVIVFLSMKVLQNNQFVSKNAINVPKIVRDWKML